MLADPLVPITTMTGGVSILPATLEDVMDFSRLIRSADRREAEALGFRSAEEGLVRGLRYSELAWTARAGEHMVCIFGVAPGSIMLETGIPWLVSSFYLEQHARSFLRHSRPYLAAMLRLYPRLRNFVDCRNTAAIRWLEWLGFTLDGPLPVGLGGEPFYRFTLEA